MSDTDARFQQAATAVNQLKQRPSNDELLKLYGLYKQGTEGDNTGKRPGMLDLKGRAKFDAWASLKGLPRTDAQNRYVNLVTELQKKYN